MIPIAARGRLILLGALVAASLAQAGLAAVAALCIQNVFDSFLGAADEPTDRSPVVIGAVLTSSALLAAGLEIFRAWAGERLGLSYVADVRMALFRRAMQASPSARDQARAGGLMLPFLGDLTAIKKWISDGFVRLIAASVMLVSLLALMAFRSPQLALAASGVVLAVGALILWLNGPLSRAIRETRSKRAAVANFVSGSLDSAQTVQAFDRLPREEARLEKRNAALVFASLQLAIASGAMAAIVHFAAAALVIATLAVGWLEIGRGAMSIGAVAAAMSISGLIAGAIRDLGVSYDLSRRARVSFAKIGRTLAMAPTLQSQGKLRGVRGGDISLTIERLALRGRKARLSTSLTSGDIVNLVGKSGAGKSYLLEVCARLREPERGRVRLNGRDMRRIAPASLRRRIGVASAATPLMRGTLAMNLRYRAPQASAAEIENVIGICGLAPLLARLPAGEETKLSDGATELSRGEAQQIMIARAMLGAPPILVLDAVDSHLDDDVAAAIATRLQSYPGIVLMAAATPTFAAIARHVWRIGDDGVTIEERDAGGGDKVVHLPTNSAPLAQRAPS